MAGTMEISSESFTGVSRFLRNRMSSSFAKMFTNRRTCPLSSQMRSLMPGYCDSRLAIRAPMVPPAALTSSFPCVSLRSGVGIRMVAISLVSFDVLLCGRVPEVVEVAEPRADERRGRQLADQRVLRLHPVARDTDDHRPVVLADLAPLDQLEGRTQRHAAGGLGEDPFGLGQQLHGAHDLGVVGLGRPA